jgi:lipopolysaccharide transport system permease protein
VIPASSVITSFVDFAISCGFLVMLMLWYHFVPSGWLVLLPVFVVLAFAASFGAGLWIAALMVEYRDFRYIVPFIVQFGLYLSPVGFSSSVVPEKWRLLYSLNPMVGIIDGFRWSIIGGEHIIYWPGLLASAGLIIVVLISGIRFFRATERTFADVI